MPALFRVTMFNNEQVGQTVLSKPRHTPKHANTHYSPPNRTPSHATVLVPPALSAADSVIERIVQIGVFHSSSEDNPDAVTGAIAVPVRPLWVPFDGQVSKDQTTE